MAIGRYIKNISYLSNLVNYCLKQNKINSKNNTN